MSGKERRKATRYVMWFPMQIEGNGDTVLGISRDISELGVSMVAAAAPQIGAEVALSIMLPTNEVKEVRGTIVRVRPNDEDEEGMWQHRVAVAFEGAVTELEPALNELRESMRAPEA